MITTENIEQAIARAGSKAGNKGYDCALSAIEMVNPDEAALIDREINDDKNNHIRL